MTTEVTRVTELITEHIHGIKPGFFNGGKDQAGHRVNVHLADGGYDATLNYETFAWVYDNIDALHELEGDVRYYEIDPLSDYEIGITVYDHD